MKAVRIYRAIIARSEIFHPREQTTMLALINRQNLLRVFQKAVGEKDDPYRVKQL